MSTPVYTPRPRSAQLFMAMPLLFGALLMISVLVLVVLVYRGTTPRGERVTVELSGECVATAQPVIEARLAAVGLDAPVMSAGDGALAVTLTLPGQDPAREATAIPRLISRQGVFAVREGAAGAVLVAGSAVEEASLQLDESGVAMAVVTLEAETAATLAAAVKADPAGMTTLWLDDELLAERPNTALVQGRDLRIMAASGTPRARMAAAADQVVVLQSGPLPCGLTVAGVVPAVDVQ